MSSTKSIRTLIRPDDYAYLNEVAESHGLTLPAVIHLLVLDIKSRDGITLRKVAPPKVEPKKKETIAGLFGQGVADEVDLYYSANHDVPGFHDRWIALPLRERVAEAQAGGPLEELDFDDVPND